MKSNRATHIPMILIHILIWVIVFCVPFFAWERGSESFSWARYLHFSMTPLIFMIVFYLNYFVLVDRLLFRRKTTAYLLVNLGVVTVCVLFLHFWQQSAIPVGEVPPWLRDAPHGYRPRPRPRHPRMTMFLLRDGVMLTFTVGIALAIKMTLQWFKTEREKQALEASRTEAELKNLKNQLNPHFLFNTLNNIYSLIEFDQQKARYAVESLSCMLRRILYNDNDQEVPLEHEFDFLRSYVELMALRLPDSAVLDVHIPKHGNGIRIAPLLFINAVENAFKHGVSYKEPSFIRIRIEIEGGDTVVCLVENSCPSRPERTNESGIGQQNLVKRLELLYPGMYDIRTEQSENLYSYRLTIRLAADRH